MTVSSAGATNTSQVSGAGWGCSSRRCRFCVDSVDVLEPDFAVGDQPPGLVGDVHPPQLLGAALIERHRVDCHGAGSDWPEEMGGVGEPDGELVSVVDGGAGPEAGRPLDNGAVHTAVHDAPRG